MYRLFACAAVLLAGLFHPIRLAASEYDQRLANISTRAQVGSGNVAVVGFVIGPGAAKNVLIRAVGPTLASFHVDGAIADPEIDVFDSGGHKVFSNDNWNTVLSAGSAASASTFSSVGAFGLSSGSRDAALVATLLPGSYTAQVNAVGAASGVAMLEVYDITGSARLMNLSSRAYVGTGSGILISGLALAPGGGARKMLIRAAGPSLAQFSVAGVLADPAIAVLDATSTQIASNDNWESLNADAISAAGAQTGAFPFAHGSKDAALIVDLQPATTYTIQVSGVGNTTGNALVEVYDLTTDDVVSVSVAATTATTDAKGAAPGIVTFSRSGSTASALTVYYTLGGAALNGVDYTLLPGAVTIPAGASSATVAVNALGTNASTSINKDVTFKVAAGVGYAVDSANAATAITIFYNPGTLYLASLRNVAAATTSTAYGTASIQLSEDGSFASVNVAVSNLSSPETAVYLRIGNVTDVGSEVLRLPPGQVVGFGWTIAPTATYSAADLVQAVKNGQIFVDIETASYPGGELRGAFAQSSGSSAFTAPAAPPALPTAPLTPADAARFLIQATFGAAKADVDALAGQPPSALHTWIDAQIALPPSSHLDATDADFKAFSTGDNPQYSPSNRQATWWKLSVSAPDQLRQRVAFALSQLFVVSDVNSTLYGTPRGMANYYDVLVRGAFGNFRDLLEQVTLSPVMGVYLSSLRNAKATFDKTGKQLTYADENFGREVMQLFTIGLNQLQPDGTLKLDAMGLPIPTYDQTTITETARAFTGWSFASDTTVNSNFRGAASNYLAPMALFANYHDDGAKTIVGGRQIPANQGGAKDLKDVLDALFNHPNVAPFVARSLIQRLVTSNPSPGYVYRVAQAFQDNGSGVRGDLGAVVRAVLLDYEARSPAVAATASFGKLKEPLLRMTALLRAYNGGSNVGRFTGAFMFPENQNDEAALRSPTVFNFYAPTFTEAGLLAGAGLVAPEFQIANDTTAISVPNFLWNVIYGTRSATNPADTAVGLQLDALLPIANDSQALIDATNLLLAGGQLPPAISDRLVAALNAMPNPNNVASNSIERVRSAIYLTLAVPQGAVQK